MRKSIDDFLISDWVAAQRGMSKSGFNKLRRRAERAGIEVPAFCYGANFRPRVTFVFPTESETDRYLRVQDTPRLEKFNKSIEAWASKVRSELVANAPRAALKAPRSMNAMRRSGRTTQKMFDLNSTLKTTLAESITANVRYDKKYKAEATHIGFNFARHGIYLYYGAGRGQGGLTGSKWTDRYGRLKTTDDASKGLMGGSRQPIDWFNPIVKKHIGELADIAADYCADMTLNLSKLFLPII